VDRIDATIEIYARTGVVRALDLCPQCTRITFGVVLGQPMREEDIMAIIEWSVPVDPDEDVDVGELPPWMYDIYEDVEPDEDLQFELRREGQTA